jgi:Domain of unknown function (DUF5655)
MFFMVIRRGQRRQRLNANSTRIEHDFHAFPIRRSYGRVMSIRRSTTPSVAGQLRRFTVAHGLTETRDWRRNRNMWVRVLERQTGEGVNAWKQRIANKRVSDERSLRAWLARQGVTGYAQSLLVMERFGYPDYVVASADQLIDQQYADRPHLRPIYDAIVSAAMQCGDVIIQARKTFVSLVTRRRTFARIQPTTKTRVDLGLRLERQRPNGRLQPSKIHESMRIQISITAAKQVDSEVQKWLRQAYAENS